MGVKDSPIAIGEHEDDRLRKAGVKTPAVGGGRRGCTLTHGQGNGGRKEGHMLPVKSVFDTLQTPETLLGGFQRFLAGEQQLAGLR